MGDARSPRSSNTSTVKALRANDGGGCLRRHRQARSPTRRSTAAHPRARATMHDTADTSRPATGQPSPPFAGPSSDRQRDAQEPHGRPDGPRASHRRHRSTTCRQPRHRPAPSRRHRLRRRDPLARARQTAPYVPTRPGDAPTPSQATCAKTARRPPCGRRRVDGDARPAGRRRVIRWARTGAAREVPVC